jgi:hypothetical protein
LDHGDAQKAFCRKSLGAVTRASFVLQSVTSGRLRKFVLGVKKFWEIPERAESAVLLASISRLRERASAPRLAARYQNRRKFREIPASGNRLRSRALCAGATAAAPPR